MRPRLPAAMQLPLLVAMELRPLAAMGHRNLSTSRLRRDSSPTHLRDRDNIRRSSLDRRDSTTTIPSNSNNSMLVQMGPRRWKVRMGREGSWAGSRVAEWAAT